MRTLLLDNFAFWDVVWYMAMTFFFVMAIWIFIRLFADIFGRHDISGLGKAGWILLLFVMPFLGALIYIIARPRPTPEEEKATKRQSAYPTSSGPRTSADDIAQAHALLQEGALTQAEFDEVKARALGKA